MTHLGRDVAERIGRVGVWTFQFDRMPVPEVQRATARIEELGAGALWIPEGVASREVFAHSTLLSEDDIGGPSVLLRGAR